LDTLNLLTLFGEPDDLALSDIDPDVFKFSDLFNENGEIYDDTMWSSPDHGDVLVKDEHGCLLSVFDCDAVSIIQSEYVPLTVMSSRQPPYRGARPKEPLSVPHIRYSCVACDFEDFQSAHSLRRHLVRIHDLGCDTIVKGRPFPHIGYVRRRANACERHDISRTVFPDDWAVTQPMDVDPEAVFDHPPFCHRFVGAWPNIRCVHISETTMNI